MTEAERDQLRERVALGVATGEERDRLAGMLARAIRDRDGEGLAAIDALIAELRILATVGSDRSSCTDALTGALLDAQIRAFERGDSADAWRRLDEIRAHLHAGGTPDLLQDRLAAALYNMIRGARLLDDSAMRLAALEELRTRAYANPSASACRVALAELLADKLSDAVERGERTRAEAMHGELERLHALDSNLALTREYARGLSSLVAMGGDEARVVLETLREFAMTESRGGELLWAPFADALVIAHARALRDDDELAGERLREQLRELEAHGRAQQTMQTMQTVRSRSRHARVEVVCAWATALRDAAVRNPDPRSNSTAERAARALAELRVLVHHNEAELELRGLLMSALLQAHRNALETKTGPSEIVERLQAEADTLLGPEREPDLASTQRVRAWLGHRERVQAQHRARVDAQLRLDHLSMVLATHASAGDDGDWLRSELLVTRARKLVERAGSPLEMVEVFAQILVNAHVDAGSPERVLPQADRLLAPQGLLVELRGLASAHPDSSSLQIHLATALFNAHVDAGARRADAEAMTILAELEALYGAHSGVLELRRRLVMALVNHQGDCLEREAFTAAGERLERVRELVHSPGADEYLHLQLAMALGNALGHIPEPREDERGQRLVSELRMLAARHDASASLRALVLDELSLLFAPQQ